MQEGDTDSEFEPEEWADPEDHEAILRATEGLAPKQTGLALEGVLQALRGDGVVDCEALARDMVTTPEKALDAVTAVLDATTRLITARVFNGDQDLHTAFARWAIANEREAYVKASEQVARSQSSKPFLALVQKHMAAVKAMQSKATKKEETKPRASKATATEEEESWLDRQEREWHERRGLKY